MTYIEIDNGFLDFPLDLDQLPRASLSTPTFELNSGFLDYNTWAMFF
jgi:hypothetical protein